MRSKKCLFAAYGRFMQIRSHNYIYTVMVEKCASTIIVLMVHAVYPSHYFGVH